MLAPIDLAMLRAGKPESPGAIASLAQVFGDCFLRPLSVLPAIAWTWLTFSGTYAVANVVRSICTVRQLPPAVYVWLFTTVVQCVIMCLKDAFLTGGIAPPLAAVVVWILRDLSFSLVVFVLPDPLSRWFTSKGVTSVAGVPIQDLLQILLPQPLQLITSPLHFLGVSYVAAATAHRQLSLAQHLHTAFREFWLRVGIRCARVLVPYCFGAVANRRLRSFFETSFKPTLALPTVISERRAAEPPSSLGHHQEQCPTGDSGYSGNPAWLETLRATGDLGGCVTRHHTPRCVASEMLGETLGEATENHQNPAKSPSQMLI